MVNNTATRDSMNHSLFVNSSLANENDEKCAFSKNLNSDPKSKLNGEFFWNKNQQGIILSAFFYGYILNQVNKSKFSAFIFDNFSRINMNKFRCLEDGFH